MSTVLMLREELKQYLVRAEMAEEVTLPADKFRDLVLQAMTALFDEAERIHAILD